jgi:hypothetical protein
MPPRKQRSDSVTGLVAAAQEAKKEVSFTWPADLVTPMADPDKQAHAQRIAEQYWLSRSERDWRPGDGALLAQLAITSTDLDTLQSEISVEGYVLEKEGSKGQPVLAKNPKLDAISMLQNRQVSLLRSLSLTGTQSDSRTTANNARAVQNFRASDEARKRNGDYSLLAL